MKRILLALTVGALFTMSVRADDAAPAKDTAQFLEQLQAKLEHTAQRMNQPSSGGSSVVGLRGSKQEPLSKQLYWKGKKSDASVTPDEIKIFRTALEQARAGQKAEAVATLNLFQDKFPMSALKTDARETIHVLQGPANSPPPALPPPSKPAAH